MLNHILIPFTFLALLLTGCSQSNAEQTEPQAGEQSFPAGYDDSDCNLQTVLDPKVPGAPGLLIPSERNPNGDSELAVLMRVFVDSMKEARIAAQGMQEQGGKKPAPMFPVHRAMRCAWPTKPDDRNEGYDQRAIAYLAQVRAFDADPSKESYNAIVSSCVACHSVSCGGVIDFIETLRWQ